MYGANHWRVLASRSACYRETDTEQISFFFNCMAFLPTCLLLTVPKLFILMDYLLVSGTCLLKRRFRSHSFIQSMFGFNPIRGKLIPLSCIIRMLYEGERAGEQKTTF